MYGWSGCSFELGFQGLGRLCRVCVLQDSVVAWTWVRRVTGLGVWVAACRDVNMVFLADTVLVQHDRNCLVSFSVLRHPAPPNRRHS